MSEYDEVAVVATSLCKEYHIGDVVINALNSLNLEVPEGELVTIHGPSGAGKTTLLNIIGGLDRQTTGEIVVLGHNLLACNEDFLATFRCAFIGFVFQSYNLISTLTAMESVVFPVEMAGWERKQASEKAEKLLDVVGLSHRANHFPSQLSGGEQQRVAFARALANDPPLLLIDEPTGNLDLETSLEIVQLIEKLKAEKKTIIVATHDERIMQLANRALPLRDGTIVE